MESRIRRVDLVRSREDQDLSTLTAECLSLSSAGHSNIPLSSNRPTLRATSMPRGAGSYYLCPGVSILSLHDLLFAVGLSCLYRHK